VEIGKQRMLLRPKSRNPGKPEAVTLSIDTSLLVAAERGDHETVATFRERHAKGWVGLVSPVYLERWSVDPSADSAWWSSGFRTSRCVWEVAGDCAQNAGTLNPLNYGHCSKNR
jgi:hypothetical protein